MGGSAEVAAAVLAGRATPAECAAASAGVLRCFA